MTAPNVPLVTAMFDSIEPQLQNGSMLEQCYAIVNVLIREPALYNLNENTLTSLKFENRFDSVYQLSRWLNDITPFIYRHEPFGDSTLLHLPKRTTMSLDTFNVDDNHARVSSFDCIESLRGSLTQLYMATVSCVRQRSYYERALNQYFQDVFLYLDNYIKVIEHEQREPEEYTKRPRQTDDNDNELPREVVSGRTV